MENGEKKSIIDHLDNLKYFILSMIPFAYYLSEFFRRFDEFEWLAHWDEYLHFYNNVFWLFILMTFGIAVLQLFVEKRSSKFLLTAISGVLFLFGITFQPDLMPYRQYTEAGIFSHTVDIHASELASIRDVNNQTAPTLVYFCDGSEDSSELRELVAILALDHDLLHDVHIVEIEEDSLEEEDLFIEYALTELPALRLIEGGLIHDFMDLSVPQLEIIISDYKELLVTGGEKDEGV